MGRNPLLWGIVYQSSDIAQGAVKSINAAEPRIYNSVMFAWAQFSLRTRQFRPEKSRPTLLQAGLGLLLPLSTGLVD